jgi:hypothetical protein
MGNQGISLISPAEFIHGMRHGGYRSPASAIAELVDNAIEAEATTVDVKLSTDSDELPFVEVLDNGTGMTPRVLRQCLQFGGTSRFNSREGMGRFGLGLPASSLSYARRVSVYSWRGAYRVHQCHLDVDEVWGGATDIREPEKAKYPKGAVPYDTGTLVIWEKCDRLDLRRLRYVVGRIHLELGRRFRRFIWNGVKIRVNGESVAPVDPLLRFEDSSGAKSAMYGSEVRLSVRRVIDAGDGTTGDVVIRFAELPVDDWYSLSTADKRKKGITRSAGVSVLRGGREVDYGWFFMGGKRRENYDDWWRCEIEFSPVLDEEFGVSHTKQQIRPTDTLIESLTPVIEPVARELSRRARDAHERLAAAERERNPLIAVAEGVDDVLADVDWEIGPQVKPPGFSISSAEKPSPELYSPIKNQDDLGLMFNASHIFFRRLNDAATDGNKIANRTKENIEMLLMAAARAELALDASDSQAVERFRLKWGKILSCYMNRGT